MFILTQIIQICLYTIIAHATVQHSFRLVSRSAPDGHQFSPEIRSIDTIWFTYGDTPPKAVAEAYRVEPDDEDQVSNRRILEIRVKSYEELADDPDLKQLLLEDKYPTDLLSTASLLHQLLLLEVIWNENRLVINWEIIRWKATDEIINKAVTPLVRTCDDQTYDLQLASPANMECYMKDGEIVAYLRIASPEALARYHSSAQMTEYGEVKVLEFGIHQEYNASWLKILRAIFERMVLHKKLDRLQAQMIVTNCRISSQQEKDVVVKAVNDLKSNMQVIIEEDNKTLHLFKGARRILMPRICNYKPAS